MSRLASRNHRWVRAAQRAALIRRARRLTRVSLPLLSCTGAMQAMMAFTQASVKPGGEVLKKGMDILKAGMMGQFPSSEVIAAVKAELA